MEESLTDPTKVIKEASEQKGGLKTMPFIIANESFEKVASYGLLPNMILYLMKEYHIDIAMGTTVLSLWSAATNFLPIVGAFVSDAFLGRYPTIALGSISSLLGMAMLWVTTMIQQLKPRHCDHPSTNLCESAAPVQLTLLYFSFILMSIGAGGIRSCSLAFGANQLERTDNTKNETVFQSYFSWYYFASSASVVLSMTVIVYIQDQFGWKVGFGVPAVLMFLAAFLFLLASSFYVKVKANESLFTGLAQVIVAAYRNKSVALPDRSSPGCRYYHYIEGSKIVEPTPKLRFLNRACTITNHEEEDLKPYHGSTANPWSLCTVEQVEELKSLVKVIPIWSTGIMLAVTVSQPSFPLLQASSMDRHVTSNFQIPAGSFTMFNVASLTIWLVIYDRLIHPQLAKLTGQPDGISLKQRMGIGLVLSCLSMAVSAIVEGIRRKTAIEQGFIDDPKGVLDMSAMWLVPQYCLAGIAEAFNSIGQLEFYYYEFPKSMSSIGTALFGLGMAFGNLIVGLIVNIVDDVTKRGGKESWVSSNLNRGHYDYYYWLLTVLSCVNCVYYLICCRAYGPCEGERVNEVEGDEEDSVRDMLLSKSREL